MEAQSERNRARWRIGFAPVSLTYATKQNYLLPVYDRPMIFTHPTLVQAGITETSSSSPAAARWRFRARAQERQRVGDSSITWNTLSRAEGGIAQALGLCEDFATAATSPSFWAIKPTDASIARGGAFLPRGRVVFLRQVPDPERFGVPVFDPRRSGASSPLRKSPPAQEQLAVTGLYLYDHRVFDFISQAKPSARGESRSPM
jgi:glucose-1-phosphate thymidylyltransferase